MRWFHLLELNDELEKTEFVHMIISDIILIKLFHFIIKCTIIIRLYM